MRNNHIVIMAGGIDSRFRPVSMFAADIEANKETLTRNLP